MSPAYGDRVGDRAQVVRRDRHAHERARVEQPPRQLLEVAVALGLALEHGRRPAVLARLDDLVVPVGALDEPDRQRRRARGSAAPTRGSGRARRASRAGRPAARPRPTARRELVLVEQLEDELERRLERVERLHVHVQVGAEVARLLRAAAAAARRRRRARAPAPRAAAAGVSAETFTDRFGLRARPRPLRHAPRRACCERARRSAPRSGPPRPTSRSPRRAGRRS